MCFLLLILQILLSFLNPGANRLRSQICEVLDTDLIRQQAQHDAVDIYGLANYVITTMGKMCAPVRDNDVKQLKATGNIVALLRLVYNCFKKMLSLSFIAPSLPKTKELFKYFDF